MTENSYSRIEIPRKITDGKTVEIGRIIEGKLYRLLRISSNGKNHYESTNFKVDPEIPDGECEYIGSMYQEQLFDLKKGLHGSPVVHYMAEIIFTWKRIK